MRALMLEECNTLRQSLSTEFFLQCASRVAASGMTLSRANSAHGVDAAATDERARDLALAAHSQVLSSVAAVQASLASESACDVARAVESAGDAGRELAHFVMQRVGQQQLLRRRYESHTGVPWRGGEASVVTAARSGFDTRAVPPATRSVASLPRSVASVVDVGWSLHGDIPARSAVRAISTAPVAERMAGSTAEDYYVMPGVQVL
jgi:hypothetical protein